MPSEGNHIFKLFFCHGKLSGVFKPASGAVHIKDQPVQSQRRIVVGASQQFFHDFLRVTPHRPVDELADEMRAISRLRLSLPAPAFSWTQAVVGTQDRIIPPDNQLRAWQKQGVAVHTLDDAHYSVPMFQHYLQDVWKNNR